MSKEERAEVLWGYRKEGSSPVDHILDFIWIIPEHPGYHEWDVDLIDRAGCSHKVAKVMGGFLAVTGKFLSCSWVGPATLGNHPLWRCKMMVGDYRGEVVLVAGFQHPAVMVQDRGGEEAIFGFNSSPFDRESISVEAKLSQQGDIFWVAMVMIDGIARWFCKYASRQMFKRPIVAVDVVAFYLVRSGRCPPKEIFWKVCFHEVHPD